MTHTNVLNRKLEEVYGVGKEFKTVASLWGVSRCVRGARALIRRLEIQRFNQRSECWYRSPPRADDHSSTQWQMQTLLNKAPQAFPVPVARISVRVRDSERSHVVS